MDRDMACTLGEDDVFGPAVGGGCRDSFDFTLLFEQSFFQIAPCALLLLLVPLRASQLRRQNVKVRHNGAQAIKQLAILVLAATQLALLLLWSLTPMYRTRTSIPAAVLAFLASLSLMYLSSIEHSRTIRPSSLINVYILLSLLFDLPQARTLWLRPGPRALPGLFTAGAVAKVVILYLEARSKRRSLFPPYRLYAPEALVSFYDRTVLWWLNPLFWQGYSSFLSIDKLYSMDDDLNPEGLERAFLRAWNKRSKGKYALLWTALKTVRSTILAMVFPRLCLSVLKLAQPLFITRVTALLSEGINDENKNNARGLIGAAVLIYVGIAITTALFQRHLHRFATKIRGILVAAVFSKALKLSSTKLADNAALTLISADVSRLEMSLQQIDGLFATPLEIGAAIYLLERQIGVSCVAPVALTIVICVLGFFNIKTALPMQRKWLCLVSDRVAFTSSVLGFSKGFKMLGLTEVLGGKIQGMRTHELAEYSHYRKYVTWRNVFSYIPTSFAPPLMLAMFVSVQGASALNPTTAFTALALVSLLTLPIQELIHTIPSFMTALASLERIQNFLLLEDGDNVAEDVRRQSQGTIAGQNEDATAIELTILAPSKAGDHSRSLIAVNQGSVVLGSERKLVLQDIDIEISPGRLHLIVGMVGSGKSILLKAILGDILLSSGKRTQDTWATDVAYCAQDPWLPNGTVRDVIIGQSEYDTQWFDTVASACALQQDIGSFPLGDQTLIGTKGVTLSGGQRQRLALARALYARKKILVADDVLSGLDFNTSKTVFARVFGPKGLCKEHGMAVVLATHSQQFFAQADYISALESGRIVEQGTFQELNVRNGYLRSLQLRADEDNADQSEDKPMEAAAPKIVTPDKIETAQQDLARKTGDLTVYVYYLRSYGSVAGVLIAISTVAFAFGAIFPNVWVRWWSEAEGTGDRSHPLAFWIGISFLLPTICCVGLGGQIWVTLVSAVTRSSTLLHKRILDTVMHAKYSFFTTTDAGVTLNRFSNDMTLIDTPLAGAFMQFTAGFVMALGSIALIMAGSSYAAVTVPFLIGTLWAVQKFYLRTSRQLRFLELEAQAPLLSHCSETLAGVTTIRAFGWKHQTQQQCHQLLDASMRASYLLLCIQRWLNLVLALCTAAIAIVVVSMALTLPSTSSAGALGVSLLGIVDFSSLMNLVVTMWTQLETSLGAVARCKNFEQSTPSEDLEREQVIPPPEWPQAGKIEIKNLSASYTGGGEDVLKLINLTINPGEKIGICGRTGSGKSSLLLTLFRLLDLSSGTISIDGIDLATVPRQIIRERFAALPQETLTFPGTLLANLDPLSRSTPEAASATLAKVGLFDLITSRGGLEAEISSFGFSQGQMQLFAVARILLRKSKVVVLDEMTSSVDRETEERMMAVIRKEFEGCTILAVAHRLDSLEGFEGRVVLDGGRVVEREGCRQ